MATIKAIEAGTVHQIQSGQVIVDLCSVVKELVENSLDAGATSIDVRFKNQGLDTIEVQDNGSGITPDNYEGLALKHYTSKLASISDLGTLNTFGFRGEALSSLCALSHFSVVTCLASSAPKATKLEFETSGKLKGTSMVAAQKGTMVTINSLFHNLPVRRRELERNIKREWNKVVALLNQYACIQTGLRFAVSQQPTKGKRIVLFSTRGNLTTRDNIINIFGAKTMTVLVKLDAELEFEPTAGPGLKKRDQPSASTKVHVVGFVSRPAHGEGRQTPDRQMFFVNGRPCIMPQFAKVFNEVYRSYNASQSPFIFADIQLDTHLYDVNVSPDKRTILMHEQHRMLENLREALIDLFESQNYSIPVSQLQTPSVRLSSSTEPARTSSPDDRRERSKKSTSERNMTPAEPDEHDSEENEENNEGEDAEGGDEPEKFPPSKSIISQFRKIAPTPKKVDSSQAASQSLMSRWMANNPPTAPLGVRESQRNAPEDGPSSQISEQIQEPGGSSQPGHDTVSEDDEEDESAPEDPDIDSSRKDGDSGSSATQGQPESANAPAESRNASSQPPIPGVTPVRAAFDSGAGLQTVVRSHKRPSPEVATVTIGDDTITAVIGSPSKRMRPEPSSSQSHPSTPASTKLRSNGGETTFRTKLTRMFGAGAATASSQETDRQELDEALSNDESEMEEQAVSESEEGQTPNQRGMSQERPTASPELARRATSIDRNSSQGGDDDQEDEGGETEGETSESDGEAEKPGEAAARASRNLGLRRMPLKSKESTLQHVQIIRLDESSFPAKMDQWLTRAGAGDAKPRRETSQAAMENGLEAEDAEERLSLTVSKADFGNMKIIGQFNLGFILAVKPSATGDPEKDDGAGLTASKDDNLFIIDQHASDEKYNFERLQSTTVVQSQRLVHPKRLELTALEEEIVRENMDAIELNGFKVLLDESGDWPVGSRCELVALPLSRETTFNLSDLEELISLLGEDHVGGSSPTPRPSKVRKMFAMRACRSSIMIGKALAQKQMETLVKHMGELDKPWNCPHGRPTMRHLCDLGSFDDAGWKEDYLDASGTGDWAEYVRSGRGFLE